MNFNFKKKNKKYDCLKRVINTRNKYIIYTYIIYEINKTNIYTNSSRRFTIILESVEIYIYIYFFFSGQRSTG